MNLLRKKGVGIGGMQFAMEAGEKSEDGKITYE